MMYIYIFIYTMGLSLRMGITVGIRKLRDKTMDDNGAQLWKWIDQKVSMIRCG